MKQRKLNARIFDMKNYEIDNSNLVMGGVRPQTTHVVIGSDTYKSLVSADDNTNFDADVMPYNQK